MNNQFRRRSFIEEESFKEAVTELGGFRRIDEALDPIVEALSRRPEGFPVVPGWSPIRIAKTDRVVRGDHIIPAIRVWFLIVDDTIRLLYVDEISNDVEEGNEENSDEAGE